MRRIIRPTLALAACLITAVTFVISSCEDNNGVVPENKTLTAPTEQVSDITFYTADITGKLELNKDELKQSEFGLLLSTSDDVMAVNSTKYPIKKFDKDYSFTLSLDGLDSVTTYYYRSYIYFEGNYFYSDVQEFTTKSPLDIIQTGNIESDSCTVKTFINSKNLLDHIQQYGISYGVNKLPLVTTDSTVTTNTIGTDGRFTLKMRNIPFDTIINYRAYVRVNNVDYYGPTLQFQGNTVRTGIINISDYTVKSHLKINDGYKELGVCYGMDSIPEIFDQKVSTTALNDSNDFKLKLVNIPFDTIVYYRAYALTGDSVYYGSINSFGGNTVTTGIIDTITFQVQSSVRFNDGISEYGVCYSNSEIPVILDKKVSVQQLDSAGCYTLSLINVPFGTVYYRSYVIKDDIAYYGDIRKFEGNSITTGSFNAESLKAQSVLRFSNSYDNPELGICYSNNQEPTIADKHVLTTISDTTCTYELLLRNMPFGAVYYRAYMMYDGFPVYGEIKQIEGNAVTTSTFIDKTLTANSSIKYSIGYDELNLGVCYSNNATPTINDKVIIANSVDSINSFALQLTEIPFGKVYYRSYMMYEGVPQYGEVKSFDGNVITTGSFNENTLIANSNLKFSAGYNNLNLGVCYSTNEQPTINDKKVTTTSVDSLNAFALQLTEIPFGKVYYRSYMMYEDTPQYGDVKSFEGNSITTGSFADDALTAKSSIKYSTGYSMLDLGVCYSTNEQPTINDKKVSTSSVDSLNSFALQLTEIPFGKVYYRSYMIFEDSPYYGEVKSFEGNAISTGSFIDSSLVANASLKFSIGYKELDLGICYGTSEQPTINDKKVTTSSVDSLNSFALGLTEVPFGKVYYRSYMMYEGKPQYGAVKSFEGNEITTGECDTATYKATASLKITKGYKLFDMGICYSNNTQPTINDNKVSTNKLDSINTYMVQLTGIPFGTIYYRSYMMLDGTPYYGEVKSCIGNELITGIYDQQSLSVKSHVKIKDSSNNLTYGICYGEITTPTVNNQKATTNVIDSNNDFTLILTNIPLGTKIYYRSYVLWNGVPYYGEIKSFQKEMRIAEDVDLGISIKWGSFNLGADMPEDIGISYKWGETKKGNDFDYKKSLEEAVDYNRILKLEYDAVNANWGNGWRMPTRDEWMELKNKCRWDRVLQNNVRGYIITGNGNSIFLPENGQIEAGHETDLTWRPEYYYWSSTLKTNPVLIEEFMMDEEFGGTPAQSNYNIRPVRPYDGNSVTSISFEKEEVTFIINDKNAGLNLIFKEGNKTISVIDKNEVEWHSDKESVAQISDGRLVLKGTGSCSITASYHSLSTSIEVNVIDEVIDLGLSVNWGTFNVGARSPEGTGYYYLWGGTEKRRQGDKGYSYNNYDKYNSTDLLKTLELTDDAANVELGGDWRMPTEKEFKELKENCNWVWTNRNGVNGMLVTSKVSGYEDKSIFIPANSYKASTFSGQIPIFILGEDLGYYWSSSLSANLIGEAVGLTLGESGSSVVGFERDLPLVIRPVKTSATWLASATLDLLETSKTVFPNKSFELDAVVKHKGEIFDAQIKWTSDNPSVATVDANGRVQTNSKGTAHITAAYSSLSAQCTVVVVEESDITHEYVDLGLSVNWATFNVGAISEMDYGDYFAWGDVVTSSSYDWKSYCHINSGDNYDNITFKKYCVNDYYGQVDKLSILQLTDDVANVKWGGDWRIPTKNEYEELIRECDCSIIRINREDYYKITGKNGNYIILPLAGYHYETEYVSNSQGNSYYWTSSLYLDDSRSAYRANIYSSGLSIGYTGRSMGFPIRPVCQSESWLETTSIELSETSKTIIPNKVFSLSATVKHNGETTDAIIRWSSDNPSVAIVDSNGKVETKSKGTAHIIASLSTKTAQCTVVVGEESDITHEYVDLGLSVKWATVNVGAISELEYGDYYAWGEIEKKDNYKWSNYKFRASGDSEQDVKFTKYVNDDYWGEVDNKTVLDLSDDVANVKWGGNWRMPTADEVNELSRCECEYTTINGIKGCIIKSRINGNTIFIPLGGYISGNEIHEEKRFGSYWTSTPRKFDALSYRIFCDPNSLYPSAGAIGRSDGLLVRPVCP